MRSEIVRIHNEVGGTTIYVTHDQVEAMTMATRIVVMKDGFVQQIGEPNELYQHPANMFVAGFIGTPAMNFIHGTLEKDGYFKVADSNVKIALNPEQKKLLKNYTGHRLVYGIRPENLVFEQDERFERFKAYSFEIKVDIVEMLGDIINVHGKVAGDKVIIKMPNKYSVKENSVIKVAVEDEYARFFNETTTKAITPDYCEYEEVEVTQSLDEDNVVIVEEKKKGLFAKIAESVKNKKEAKKSKQEDTTSTVSAEGDSNTEESK